MDIKKGYKETEIGVIPEEWEVDVLENNANILMGQSPLSKYYNSIGEGIPFMQGRKTFGDKYPYIDKWCTKPKRIARKGSVLMSVRAPVGDLNIANRELCIGRGLASLEMKNKNNEFLYYLLKNYNDLIIKQETGTVFGSISKSGIENLKLPFPPLNEQKAIADILSSLDDKIEVNNQINKTLEEIAQAIFKHWFIDFEFPNEKGKPYKSSGGKMVESELGLIPKGWEVKELGDLGEFKNGINYNRNVKGKSEYYIVNVRDIVENTFIRREKLEKINIDSKKAEKYLLKEKDILIIRSASPGEIGILAQPQDNIIYSGFTIRYSLIDKQLFYYLYFVLKNVKKNLEQLSNGTTLRNINQKILKSYKVILPNKRILQNSNKIFICILDKINQINNENQVLSQIRDTLLPKLMSGEIRVV